MLVFLRDVRMKTCILFLLSLSGSVVYSEEIALLYSERPPYLISQKDSSASGLTGTPASEAIKKAGFTIEWIQIPTSRQLEILKRNEKKACAIGWFKNPEREKFAKFTNAIYQDKPTVAIVNSDLFKFDGVLLEKVLREKKVKVLLNNKFSYGSYVDGIISKVNPSKEITSAGNIHMLRMLKAKRANLMFASDEEAQYIIEQDGKSSELKKIKFIDLPKGEKRYLMCSKNLSDESIQKINSALLKK